MVGTEFERILGIVDYRDGRYNLVPRIASDMPRPPAALDGCVPISSSYIFCREGLGWRNANRECIRRGARLVVLETGEENELAGELVARWHDGSFWIGLSDTANEGEFVWVNGDELTYSGWAGGEPNDYGAGEDCAESNWRGSGVWNDARCGGRKPFLCEFGDGVPSCEDQGDCEGQACVEGICQRNE